ncbi:hypothetical protein GCM10010238_32930 [Streptomyces griseoviridis]|uniref:Uncharacterized protein n=1 Tax=Streptomyces griseoviridis TaxID=45398 RepID=A0A918LFR0_STRGD|nr:hypothetical protein GCM10010238_32930 [Streptomyces niveoruber]
MNPREQTDGPPLPPSDAAVPLTGHPAPRTSRPRLFDNFPGAPRRHAPTPRPRHPRRAIRLQSVPTGCSSGVSALAQEATVAAVSIVAWAAAHRYLHLRLGKGVTAPARLRRAGGAPAVA